MNRAPAIDIPALELIYEDGMPMDSAWHRDQMALLAELTHRRFRGQRDYYTGGNMFIYYSLEQAREVREGSQTVYRGPDYFTVLGVDRTRERKAWVAWEEGGRFPNIIIELLSPSTWREDVGTSNCSPPPRLRGGQMGLSGVGI